MHSDSAPIAAAKLEITILEAWGRNAAGWGAARFDDARSDAARFDDAGSDDAGSDDAGSDDAGLNHEIMGQEIFGQEMIGAKERSRAFPGANSARSIPVPSSSVSSFAAARGTSAIMPGSAVIGMAEGTSAIMAGSTAIGIIGGATYCPAVCSGWFAFTASEASSIAARVAPMVSAVPISGAGGTKYSTTPIRPISSDGSYSCETTAACLRKRLLMSAVWRGFSRGSESCRKLRKVQSR